MASSPIYGWAEPDNTDLVKNGALAIRTLGNAIDTTMATMTPKSTYTAKGSIAAASAASTPANLSVGADGTLITADSTATTGLSYQSNFAAGKNKVINGDCRISQRGTSFTIAASGYCLDRYSYAVATAVPTGTISQQTFTPATAPVAGYEGSNYMRVNVTANAGCTVLQIINQIEDVRTLAGQTATFSLWAKADATSTLTATFTQNFGSGGSGGVNTTITLSSSGVLTTGWVRYTGTISVPSISGKTIGTSSYISIVLGMPTSAGVVRNGTYDFWGWQLEANSVATAFQTASGSLGGELALCQRYYLRTTGATYTRHGRAQAASTTLATIQVPLPASLRTVPSVAYANTAYWNGTTFIANTGSAASIGTSGATVYFDLTVASGLILGQTYEFLNNNNAAGYVEYSAEL